MLNELKNSSSVTFEKELEVLINRYSKENGSDTPDFILAEYLKGCLDNYNRAVRKRDNCLGVKVYFNK